MKNLILTSMVISGIFTLNGCSSNVSVAPSRNSALNSVSNSSGKEKSGYMQKAMDGWVKSDWTPSVSKDKEIQEKYMKKIETSAISVNKDEEKSIKKDVASDTNVEYIEDKNRNFTLQEYVDRATVYKKSHPNNDEDSHVKKMKSMPVIGK